jgi:hypothetical protein
MGFSVGDVVRYSRGSDWAQHGIAIVHESGGTVWAADTYWNDRNHGVDLTELEGKELLGNILTFSTKVPYPYVFDDYADADKFYIPIGGGSAQMWVRMNIPPDPEKVSTRLRYELQKAHNKVRSAAQDVEYHTKQLMKFEHKLKEYGVRKMDKGDQWKLGKN